MALGRGEEAVQMLEKAPTDAGLLANYALALLVTGDVSKAETAVNASREFEPDDVITQKLAGLIAVRTGQTTGPERWPR